jgi:hypothetical protein
MPLKERHATGRAFKDDPPRPVHLFGVEAHNFARFQMFIGQGRQLGYCGRAEAVASQWLAELGTARDSNGGVVAREQEKNVARLTSGSLTAIGEAAAAAVTDCSARRPLAWWFIWLFSWLLVGWQVWFAYMISHNTPSIGFGCRSGSYVVYFGLSSLTRLLQPLPAYRNPSDRARRVCHVLNTVSLLCLVFIVFVQVCPQLYLAFPAQKSRRLPVAAAN